MTQHPDAPIAPAPPRRADGPLELRVRGATDERLVAGLQAARAVLDRRGVTAGRAVVCHTALTAFQLDPTLPEPDASVVTDAQACREAHVAAIEAAGGSLDGEDALAFDQGEDGRALWETLPTLREWRSRNAAQQAGGAPP